jgi:hypothetical protein
MEVFGPRPRLGQQQQHRPRIDLADVGRGLHTATVAQTFDDPHDRLLGQLAARQQRSLPLAEAVPATAAVQPPNATFLAHPLAYPKIARGESIEVAALLVGTGETRQVVFARNDVLLWLALAYHGIPP